ncbi:MAG: hypothetical protein ACJ77E_17550 [Gaiellaceae bacterium]
MSLRVHPDRQRKDVTKTDGSHVTVVLDKDLAVLSVESDGGHGFGDHQR